MTRGVVFVRKGEQDRYEFGRQEDLPSRWRPAKRREADVLCGGKQMIDDKRTSDAIETLEKALEDIRDQDLLSASLLERISSSVAALKTRVSHLQAIEGAVEAIREEILAPVQRGIVEGNQFSRRGYFVGAIGIALTMGALAVSIVDQLHLRSTPKGSSSADSTDWRGTPPATALGILGQLSPAALQMWIQDGNTTRGCYPDSINETMRELQSHQLLQVIAKPDTSYRHLLPDSIGVVVKPTSLGYNTYEILKACVFLSSGSWMAHTSLATLSPGSFDFIMGLSDACGCRCITPSLYDYEEWYYARELERRGLAIIECDEDRSSCRCEIRLTAAGQAARDEILAGLEEVDFALFRAYDVREVLRVTTP